MVPLWSPRLSLAQSFSAARLLFAGIFDRCAPKVAVHNSVSEPPVHQDHELACTLWNRVDGHASSPPRRQFLLNRMRRFAQNLLKHHIRRDAFGFTLEIEDNAMAHRGNRDL